VWRTFFEAVNMAEAKRRPLVCQGDVCPAIELMRREGRSAGYLLRVRESFEEQKNRIAFEFKIHEGFRRSFGWIPLEPLYTWKRGWQWFFTLPFALAFRFYFRNLRE
jgi:hypothetical protein